MLNGVFAVLKNCASRSTSPVLAVAGTYWDYRQFSSRMAGASAEPAQSADARRYLDELEKTGICIVEGFWDPKTCADARAEVDRVIEQYPKFVNGNAKADMRVYGANNASALIAQFAEHPVLRNIATAYNCENTRTAFTLAAKLPASVGNQGSGEGWHRDAFLRQFKAILYLTDVSPDNGPFQLVKDSHRRWQVLRDIWAGRLRYMQYRISEPEVAHILKGDQGRLLTYTAKAGTLILVDTSSIHRGMPIKAGTRYALTNYYFPDEKIDSGLYEKFDVLQAGKAACTG